MTQYACMVLWAKVVVVSRRQPHQVEDILALITPQNALNLYAACYLLLGTFLIYELYAGIQLKLFAYLLHQESEFTVIVDGFAIVNGTVLTALQLIGSEDSGNDTLSDNSISTILHHSHVQHVQIGDIHAHQSVEIA